MKIIKEIEIEFVKVLSPTLIIVSNKDFKKIQKKFYNSKFSEKAIKQPIFYFMGTRIIGSKQLNKNQVIIY